MKVRVYHNRLDPHEGFIPFLSPACEHCRFILAYEYEAENGNLDAIWRENNRVDGTDDEYPVIHGTRSLSVGDLIQLDGDVFTVEVVGWKNVAWEPAV